MAFLKNSRKNFVILGVKYLINIEDVV